MTIARKPRFYKTTVFDANTAHKQVADQHLATGDLVQAMEALQKVSAISHSVSERISYSLDRMRKLARRELSVGRWTVAEGIFDAVKDNQRLLSPGQLAECAELVRELRRCRAQEQQSGTFQAALQLASAGLHKEAREVCTGILSECRDVPVAGRLRRLLFRLQDQPGRLLYGFDSEIEVSQFCRSTGGATIAYINPKIHFTRGGYAWITLPGPKAQVIFADLPSDWSHVSEITFWVKRAGGDGAAFQFRVGGEADYFVFDAALSEPAWTELRVPLKLFERKGSPSWKSVSHAAIASADRDALELHLDELRLVEKGPSTPPAPHTCP